MAADWLAATAGIEVAVVIAVVSTGLEVARRGGPAAFAAFKRRMGCWLLIGLDIVIAADIIETVRL